MKQLDLFQWADSRPPEARPSAIIIDLIPAIIKHICAQPYSNPRKDGELIPIRRNVA